VTANLIGSLSDPRVWMEHIEASAMIYSWAINNHWHTNYRADQEGPTVFRYFILPHERFSQTDAALAALQCSQPVVVAPAKGDVPTDPPVRLSNSNVLVSALKPSNDRQAEILRLFGISGKDEEVEVTWLTGAKTVSLSDGGERAIRKVSGPIRVPAYSIVTLRAETR